jgi:hypothetical protein
MRTDARFRSWSPLANKSVNEALILRLAAEFQGFGRGLHDQVAGGERSMVEMFGEEEHVLGDDAPRVIAEYVGPRARSVAERTERAGGPSCAASERSRTPVFESRTP